MNSQALCITLAVSMVLSFACAAEQPSVPLLVVPSAFASREDDGYSGSLGTAMRLQCVYGPAHFPTTPLLIRALRYRRDASVGAIPPTTLDARIRLSTTTKPVDGLGSTFDHNLGPDAVVVADGPIEVASETTSIPGGPQQFDIVLPFATPFRFDPGKGNLLFEITTRVPSSISWVDASNDSDDAASRAFAFGPAPTTASTVDTGADILGFVVEDAPALTEAVLPPEFAAKEDDGYTGPFGTSMRLQNVYAASYFAAPITIREIRYRRDGSLGPVASSSLDLRIRLSSTPRSPGALSSNFGENLGPDATVVLDGVVSVGSPSPGVPGGPQPFEVLLPLATPFHYNPARGNLLIDIASRTTSLVRWIDGSNDAGDQASRVFSFDVNAEGASFSDSGADIVMLSSTVTPPPPEVFVPVVDGPALLPTAGWMSAAWGDYDGDGDQDLFVAGAGTGNHLYRNDAGVLTEAGGVVAEAGNSVACAWVDFDNDGDLDLYVTNNGQDHFLYANNGDGSFTKNTTSEVTASTGECWASSWADYDRDGLPDAMIAGAWKPNILFHNLGGGRFARITEGAIVNESAAWDGGVWGDYDGDGWPDYFAVSGGDGLGNVLYHNDGNGSFTRLAGAPMVADNGASTSSAWGDYDNDGDLDLVVANRDGGEFLYRNDGNGQFTKITDSPVVTDGGESNGCAWLDYDNDGWLDLFIGNYLGGQNFLYRNQGNGTFVRVLSGPGTAATETIGVAATDYTGDGYPDLMLAGHGRQNTLYRNSGGANGWLVVKCVGTRSNSGGLGARVRVQTTVTGAPLTQMREISAGGGWSSPNPRAEFGLGNAPAADLLRVEWPSGIVTELRNVPANQVLTIVEQPPALEIVPGGGYFTGTLEVMLKSTVEGGEVRYTVDGSEPVVTSTPYTPPLWLATSTRVKARVFKNGEGASDVVEALFLESRWNDGIPAAWREQYFGGNWFTKPEALALADGDNDGVTTYQEWLAQTSPVDATSKRTWPASASPYAGSTSGYRDGPRLAAQFDGGIADMAFDAQGRLWLLEASALDYTTPGASGQRVRRIEADGTVVTVAGAEAGFADGPATQARFSIPQGLAFGADGSVFIADRGNNRIRKLDAAGNVTTVAGSAAGYQDGPAAEALFNLPMGLATDAQGNLFVADFGNLRIRQIAPGGTVSTFANAAGNRGRQDGPRLEASFDVPNDLAFGPDGSLYVSDWSNQAVRRISPDGMVSTVSRSQGWMERVSLDAAGNVYSSSSSNGQSILYLEKRAPDGEHLWTLSPTTLFYFGFEGLGKVIELPGGDLLVGDKYRVQRLRMTAPAVLVMIPNGGEAEVSQDVTFTTSAIGGSIRYTTDGSEPSPASPEYRGTAITLTASATVQARVFVNGNAVSAIVSHRFTIKDAAPTITRQPVGGTLTEGAGRVFRVEARGTAPLTYQWMLGGTDLAGATAAELSITAVALADAGTYTVRVSNALGSVVSEPAVLVVNPKPQPPKIVKAPRGQSVVVGSSVTFTVEVTGTEPFTYVWYRNGSRINGATNGPSFTLPAVKLTDSGSSFSVRVSNPVGLAASGQARLTVTETAVAPVISAQPAGGNVPEGGEKFLLVIAGGTTPLAYQWHFNGQPVPGANASEWRLTGLTAAQAGTYWVVVSNVAGRVVSNPAVVQVTPSQPGGTVNLANFVSGAVDAPVRDRDGVTLLGGTAFLAQLYAGPSADQLGPVGGAVPFQSSGNGYVVGPNLVTITSVPAGTLAFVQMRAWESARGPSHPSAELAGGSVGASAIFSVTTGGGGTPPADLVGLQGFQLTRETEPPRVAITAPVAGTTSDDRFTLAGTVTDNLAVASARWSWNGEDMGPLPLVDVAFSVAGQRLRPGENRLEVTAADTAGNTAGTGVMVVYAPARILSVTPPEPVQEGRRIPAGLVLTSPGGVSGLTFLLHYDAARFRDPELTWTKAAALEAALTQVNLNVDGEARVTLSLPGGELPAGAFQLATLALRCRSVPGVLTTELVPELLDLSDQTGATLAFGNAVVAATARITPRRITGDNNGNDALDVGDATLIQRLIAQLDVPQDWDVAGNDLNQSLSLDSGDVVKVLRVVVGLDPAPVVPAAAPQPGRSPSLKAGVPGVAVSMTSDRTRVWPGDTVTVQVGLAQPPAGISGASFKLSYPTAALRLRAGDGIEVGPAVPAGVSSLLNVDETTGQISFAASGARVWPDTGAAVLELTFEVLPASNLTSWPVSLLSGQVAWDNGYEVQALAPTELVLHCQGPQFEAGVRVTSEGVRLAFGTEAGARYTVENSIDLKTWSPLDTLTGTRGVVEYLDTDPDRQAMRFYRISAVR